MVSGYDKNSPKDPHPRESRFMWQFWLGMIVALVAVVAVQWFVT